MDVGTQDEQTGMTWWNGLPEGARGFWLRQANSAIAADAWAAYKASPDGQGAYRVFDGICVDGRDLNLTITAGSDGLLHVTIVAEPGATGFDRPCRLNSHDSPNAFPLSEICVMDDRLECFAPCSSYPGFKEGFKMPLELQMAEQLRRWLPRLGASAALAQAMAALVQSTLQGKALAHMQGFTSELAARIVLDGLPPADALQEQIASHWAGEDADFVAVFRNQVVLGPTLALQKLMGAGENFDDGENCCWIVDGTSLTVVTVADVPQGQLRERMRQELARQDRSEGTLRCVHRSASFHGKSGTQVYGHGWRVHVPQGDKQLSLWEAVQFACTADWSEVEAQTLGPAGRSAQGLRQIAP